MHFKANVKSNANPLKIFNHIFLIFCTAGLTVHVVLISVQYFEYGATTSVMMDVPSTEAVPALSICWRFVDVLDVRKLNAERGKNLTAMDFNQPDDAVAAAIHALQEGLTLDEIFAYTPQADEVFSRAIIRYPGEYAVAYLDRDATKGNFTVEKFYVQVRHL